MKHIFSVSIEFCKKNGLLGLCLRKISQIRGGEDKNNLDLFKDPSSSSLTRRTVEDIDEILKDNRISENLKTPFRSLREDLVYGNSEKLKRERLKASLIAKSKHPFYAKIKGKVPYLILSPFTFAELSRLATYRVSGFASAPFNLPAFLGFSMPCAVTFSMLEMYAPDRFKFPCKCFKWTGGAIFYGVCSSLDYATAGIETKAFGEPLPIDAPELMGSLPTKENLEEVKKLKALTDSLIKKSN